MRRLGGNDLELLERLFEQLPDAPFFVKDQDLRYVAANIAMAKLCGVKSPRDLRGSRAGRFFPTDLARRYEALDVQVLTCGRAITNQLELTISGDGVPAWLLFSRLPVIDEAGQTIGIAGTSRRLKQPEGTHPVYRRIADALERLRHNWDQPLHLAQLAAAAGTSKSQLERDFERLLGVSPQSFLQQTRMERAVLMLETSASIATIAYECGYADHSAFTRRFRQMIGISPSRYRNRIRERQSGG